MLALAVPSRVGPVDQRLAAQAPPDVAGFTYRERGGTVIAGPHQVPGLTEQAVGQVMGVPPRSPQNR